MEIKNMTKADEPPLQDPLFDDFESDHDPAAQEELGHWEVKLKDQKHRMKQASEALLSQKKQGQLLSSVLTAIRAKKTGDTQNDKMHRCFTVFKASNAYSPSMQRKLERLMKGRQGKLKYQVVVAKAAQRQLSRMNKTKVKVPHEIGRLKKSKAIQKTMVKIDPLL